MLGMRLSQLDPRLAAVFLEEERAGVRLAVQVRLAALGVIALWIAVRVLAPTRKEDSRRLQRVRSEAGT